MLNRHVTTSDIEEVSTMVESLNEQILNGLNKDHEELLEYNAPLVLTQNLCILEISYFGITIWDCEMDERIFKEDEAEDLKVYICRRINQINAVLGGIIL